MSEETTTEEQSASTPTDDAQEINATNQEALEETQPDDKYDQVWEEDTSLEDIFASSNNEPEETHVQDELETPEPLEGEDEEEIIEDNREKLEGIIIDEPLKYKDKEIVVESKEEAKALMQKGLDYELKMAKIKPHLKDIELIKSADLTSEEIKALADAKAGKPEALEYLKNAFGLKAESNDSFDENIFEDEPTEGKQTYKPEVEADDPVKSYWQDFQESQPADAGKVIDTYNNLDETFKAELYDPKVFPLFVGSVVEGEFEKVYPVAIKEKALNPAMNWVDAYARASQKVLNGQNQETQTPTKEVSIPKQKQTGSTKDRTKTAYDKIWDDDSEFQAIEKQIFG